MKNKGIFLRNPPEELNFSKLFRFIWVQGIGNTLDQYGEPQPWTDGGLENRFYEFGYEIDKRTIQNWLAGNNQPSAKNLHRLARIVSNDEADFKTVWRDALTMTSVLREKNQSHNAVKATKDTTSKIKGKTPSALATKIIIAMGIVGAVIAWVILYSPTQTSQIQVTNLKFCDEVRFDRTAKICKTNVTHFPEGIKLIFVSFGMPDAPEGQPFERRWYRNGQMFLERDGFKDAVWEDYTWLGNEKGHDNGKFDLRIIVNGEVTTGSFFVGNVNQSHQTP